VSFLSRFSIGGKKKDQDEDVDDDESELGDFRTEGMNAQVFSSTKDANGYIPQHKEPPRYIKVRAKFKREREFNRMFLAQELSGTKHGVGEERTPGALATDVAARPSSSSNTGGAIWSTEFSIDGKYLAAAGQDQVVRVWSVISTAQERAEHEREEDLGNGRTERLSAPVFRSKPIREFEGHTSTVLDLSWSKNNFLLSSSMDKTVRLWHISRQECLCTFKHKDFVTSIAFHPKDDRFFLAGSLDSVLRLWSIPDKSVAFWSQLPDLITAVAFAPDGRTAMAGVLSGLCLFYETEGLKLYTQIHVRSSRGKNAKGSKITGIRTATYPPDDPNGEVKVLISSNDSRVRLYNLRDKSLEMKFRGHENTCSQIRASFSDDCKYVICGSEDRRTYIWSTGPVEGDNKDKRPVEIFAAHSDMVTTSIMAPAKTRQLLGVSGDPIYDLCNPPPVTLLSRAETRSTTGDDEKWLSDTPSGPADVGPTPTSAYLVRNLHNDGNIIITADHSGSLKVFRQDCAFIKRRNDTWETSSTFSRKLQRHGSLMARRSGSTHSRRNSLGPGHGHSLNPARGSATHLHAQQDHILDWANSIHPNASTDGLGSVRSIGSTTTISAGPPSTRPRSERSASPSVFTLRGSALLNPASEARQAPYAVGGGDAGKPTPNANPTSKLGKSKEREREPMPGALLPTPSFSLKTAASAAAAARHGDENENPSALRTGFWNVAAWKKAEADRLSAAGSNGGDSLNRERTMASRLSSDTGPSMEGADEAGGEEDAIGMGMGMACKRCGGREFVQKKGGLMLGRGQGMGGRVVCGRCGAGVE